MNSIRILRAGPMTTLQDRGRFGYVADGISTSGPMDRASYFAASDGLTTAGDTGIEFTPTGLAFTVSGQGLAAGFAGGEFQLRHNGKPENWPACLNLADGDEIAITPGSAGNYGYVRFSQEIEVAPVLGSRSTNSIAGIGGYRGRGLIKGDVLELAPARSLPVHPRSMSRRQEGPIRFIWGLHAELFGAAVRERFATDSFAISASHDRMGVRLDDRALVFGKSHILSLVSDAIVPGDIQILGDGTPIVLMRDHQLTGGYPRIGTIISADMDRFSQLRPGAIIQFQPVTPSRAYAMLRP